MILDRSYSEKFAKSGDLQSPDHKNTYEFVVAILTILSSSTSSFVHIYILDNKASAHYIRTRSSYYSPLLDNGLLD